MYIEIPVLTLRSSDILYTVHNSAYTNIHVLDIADIELKLSILRITTRICLQILRFNLTEL